MKRFFSQFALVLLASLAFLQPALATDVTMYKNASCGCCGKWAQHLRDNGFNVKEISVADMAEVKQHLSVPQRLAACHTAEVNGYVIEGHVPAASIKRLLDEKPRVKGLAVPGMPAGSPGMEGGRHEPYDVLTFDRQGKITVFSSEK